jgi:DNA modification methylase
MFSHRPPNRPSPALSVTNVPIEQLHLDPRNPRVHKPKQIRSIAESIKQFGFIAPVVTDGQGRIIAGHGRVLAAQKLGWTEVPAIRIEHLSEPQIRAYQIADNKLNENAGWNDQLLGEIFLELSILDLEFSTDITGFSVGEIDLLIEGIGLDDKAKPDAADRLPPSLPGPAVTEPGDLWLLGRHRLLCGDALDPHAYQTLMQGALADMVFTDPPYNVAIQGHASGLGASTHREFAVAAGEMTPAAYGKFLKDSMHLLADHSRDGSLHYIFSDWRQIGVLLAAAADVYTEHHNICVWEKNNAGMGSFYRSRHEFVSVHKKGRAAHRNNIELGRHGRNRTNVWNYPAVNSFSRTSDEGNILAWHPTPKPVALVADAMLDASARGDLVLDGFLGSGTTLIAAERVGRRCHGLELDPGYVDTIIRRWEVHTGDTARHSATGQTFMQMAARRRDAVETSDDR